MKNSVVLFGKTIPLYGVCFYGGIALAVLFVFLLSKKKKVDLFDFLCCVVYTMIGALIVAKLLFVLVSLREIIQLKLNIIEVIKGGYVFYGGLLGGALGIWIYAKQFRTPVRGYVDIFAAVLPLGHACGRVGCFFAGCCYGAETDCFLGVCFPGMAHPVLPTQLFEAAFEFLMFAAMLVFYKKLRKHFLETYMIGYGVFRFVMEFFRADDRGSTGFFLTPSQLISIIMVVAAVLLILYYKGVLFKKTYAKMASYRKEAEKYGVYMRGDVDATVRQLKGLQKDGVITQEEFEQAKTTLYNRL